MVCPCHKLEGCDPPPGHSHVGMYTITVLGSANCASCSSGAPPVSWPANGAQSEDFRICDHDAAPRHLFLAKLSLATLCLGVSMGTILGLRWLRPSFLKYRLMLLGLIFSPDCSWSSVAMAEAVLHCCCCAAVIACCVASAFLLGGLPDLGQSATVPCCS